MATISAPEALPPSQGDGAVDASAQADYQAAEAALASKYGGLPKANPIFAHTVKKEKHYFDSGDWQLQQQGGMGQAGLPNFGEDTAQRPLAYDHHNWPAESDPSKQTSQPPKMDKRPGVSSPRSSIGGKGGSGHASPRGAGAVQQHAAAAAEAAAAMGETVGPSAAGGGGAAEGGGSAAEA